MAVTTSTPGAGGLDGVDHVPRFGICLAIAVPGYCHKTGAAVLHAGLGTASAMTAMTGGDPDVAYRQLAGLDTEGGANAHTGEKCVPHASHKIGSDYIVLGNWLASRDVVEGMERAYLESKGETVARHLIAALEGGRDAGGEISHPLISALMISYGDREGTPLFDLRCDGAPDGTTVLPEDPVARLLLNYEFAKSAQPAIELGRKKPETLWAEILQAQ